MLCVLLTLQNCQNGATDIHTDYKKKKKTQKLCDEQERDILNRLLTEILLSRLSQRINFKP